jgi:hypothetical protein
LQVLTDFCFQRYAIWISNPDAFSKLQGRDADFASA